MTGLLHYPPATGWLKMYSTALPLKFTWLGFKEAAIQIRLSVRGRNTCLGNVVPRTTNYELFPPRQAIVDVRKASKHTHYQTVRSTGEFRSLQTPTVLRVRCSTAKTRPLLFDPSAMAGFYYEYLASVSTRHQATHELTVSALPDPCGSRAWLDPIYRWRRDDLGSLFSVVVVNGGEYQHSVLAYTTAPLAKENEAM